MKVRKFRLLRQKYGISLDELGGAAGVSCQRISQLELDGELHTKQVEETVSRAFLEIMANQLLELSRFELDYMNHQDSLFEAVEENYEL